MCKRILMSCMVLFIAGCSGYKTPSGRLMYGDKDLVVAENKLAAAAESVSQSLAELAEIEKNLHPHGHKNIDSNLPKVFELEQLISLDWNGPVDNLMKYLAKSMGYRYRILGKLSGTPILITLSAKNSTVGEVLKNINLQCGHKANVVVDVKNKTLELRYIK